MVESLKEEIDWGTRVTGLFTNGASALRLISAVLMEITGWWPRIIEWKS
jgi:transposase-like protein